MKLEAILDYLCKMTGRDITIFYPTKQSEIVPYLKKRNPDSYNKVLKQLNLRK